MGITKEATPEQIKDAYRDLVKKHHPDVAGSSSPDANLFREIMEAYSVLSVSESRTNYDILKKKNSDLYSSVSEAEFIKKTRPDLRNQAGGFTSTYKPGSYAEERSQELA